MRCCPKPVEARAARLAVRVSAAVAVVVVDSAPSADAMSLGVPDGAQQHPTPSCQGQQGFGRRFDFEPSPTRRPRLGSHDHAEESHASKRASPRVDTRWYALPRARAGWSELAGGVGYCSGGGCGVGPNHRRLHLHASTRLMRMHDYACTCRDMCLGVLAGSVCVGAAPG